MNFKQGLCCLLLAAAPLAASAGDTPGSYTNYRFAPAVSGLDAVDFGITVQTDPGYRANVYWSNQFGLVGTGSGGYTGMQSNGGDARQFLFSIWDATEAKPGSEGSYCIDFGGEGVGKSCRMNYEWKQGHTYRFHVAYEGDQWLGVTVTDLATGHAFKLGSIRTASSQISPQGMVNWTEYFEWSSPDSNCYNQPYSAARFDLPSGNGGQAMASISATSLSQTCTAASKVEIDPRGSVQRNAIGNSLRGPVVGASGRCVDAQGGANAGVPAIGYACTGGANQAWVLGADRTLRLENNLCLEAGADASAAVSVVACNAGPSQQWSVQGGRLVNAAKGLCLSETAADQPLALGRCDGTAAQRWTLPLAPN